VPQPHQVENGTARLRSRGGRIGRHWRVFLALALVAVAMGLGAVSTNALGAGDRFEGLVERIDRLIAGPVPERSTRPTVAYTPPPVAAATSMPTPMPRATGPAPSRSAAVATPTPAPTPTPLPARVAVDFTAVPSPADVFSHQATKDWCAVAGTQMVLAIHGKAPTSDAFQQEIASRIKDWESVQDSRNGNWGPAAMALALDAYGVPGYEIRAYDTRADALRDSARAIKATGAPVVLLTWRGAHTWVMSGYRADADPSVFPDATVTGAYILDPWYPWESNIWGQSDPPGAFQDAAEMERNYLAWKRPEGEYPDRDGKFIAVVPTLPLTR